MMHVKRKIITYMLTAALIINLLPQPAYGEDLVASGTTAGDSIIKNASYSDIAGNANADNIMKMSVYSIVREYGSNTYRPNQAAAKQDILAALVRATGRQEQAVQLGEQLLAGNPSLSSVNSYLMGHIEAAKAAGIITAQEATVSGTLTAAELATAKAEADAAKKANWKMTKVQYDQLLKQKTDQLSFSKTYRTVANREETALWIARALSLQPVAAEEITAVYNYTDWASIKTENLPYIEAVLKKGIMKNSAAAFSPKGNISRGEMASIMNMVSNQSLDKLGYKTGHGKVTSVSMARDIGAVSDTYTTTITIETPAADNIGVNIQKRSTTSSISQESVPVIKNGKIGNETLVAEGDIVEYTLNKDNEAILLHIAQLKEIDGTFVVYDPQQNTVQVGDKNNNMYFLKVMPDSVITVQKEPVDIGRLEPNSPAKAVFANDILKSISVDTPPELVGGTETPVRIIFADTAGNLIKVADEYDNKRYLELADTAAIYINGELQDISAVGYDQDAVVRIFNGKVQEVKIYTDIPEEDPNIRLVLTAEVKSISDSGITLLTDADPKNPVLYTIDSNTPIIKEKQSVRPSALRQGDRVKIEVNSVNDRHITRMEVQGEGVLVEKLYKGDIREIMPETGELVLANVYYYGYYDWVKQDGYIRYKLSSEADIYNGDTKISPDRLKDYVGKSIYAVSKKDYGTEELVKAVLKDGYEDTIYESISDVKWTTRQLTLSDGRILGFNDGSIIIKDGRLLDSLYLSGGSEDAFVIQNRSTLGVGSAPIISFDSFNGFSDYRITRGYLHNMGEDYYTVENSYTLENNEWRESGEPTYLLNDETYVYDNVIVKGFITPEEFAKSRFIPFTYTWPNYKAYGSGTYYHEDDKYHYNYDNYKNSSKFHQHFLIYTITDNEGNTHAINLVEKNKDSFNEDRVYTERLFAGQIGTVDTGNKRVILVNAKTYSEATGKWRPAEEVKPVWVKVPINMEKAVILKDRKAITMSELEEGDNVYILSDNDYSLFMMVE
ncbi:MAG TPA: S-layer homology domain-containing protein [Clostridia bacterium]|nr:S-layer homology domain-containing protein [Clostridia bacterium]